MSKKKNRFNLVAGIYDPLAFLVFRDLLKKAQLTYLEDIPEEAHVLIIGGGTGWILKALLKRKPHVAITYVEASSKMLEFSAQYVTTAHNVRFVHGTERDIGNGCYDCIITNFFLDVFAENQLPAVMLNLKARLGEEGRWLCTDFRHTGRLFDRLLIGSMHLFFKIFAGLSARRLLDFRKFFESAELQLEKEKTYRKGLVFSAMYRKKK